MCQTGMLSLAWHPQPQQPQWTLLPAVAGMMLPLKVLFCRSCGFQGGYARSHCRAWVLNWARASKRMLQWTGGLQVFTSSCSGVGLPGLALERWRESFSTEKGRKEESFRRKENEARAGENRSRDYQLCGFAFVANPSRRTVCLRSQNRRCC